MIPLLSLLEELTRIRPDLTALPIVRDLGPLAPDVVVAVEASGMTHDDQMGVINGGAGVAPVSFYTSTGATRAEMRLHFAMTHGPAWAFEAV